MMFGSPHVNESFEITAFGVFWLGIEWFFFNYTGNLKHKFDQSSSESSKQIRISIIIVLKCFLITCPSSDSFLGQIFIKLFQLRIHNSELLPRNRGRSPPRAGARGRDGQAAKHLPTPGGHDFALSQGMTSETVLGLGNLNLHLGKFNMEPKNHIVWKGKNEPKLHFFKMWNFTGVWIFMATWNPGVFWCVFSQPRGGEVN